MMMTCRTLSLYRRADAHTPALGNQVNRCTAAACFTAGLGRTVQLAFEQRSSASACTAVQLQRPAGGCVVRV